jgi:hypothetical protein
VKSSSRRARYPQDQNANRSTPKKPKPSIVSLRRRDLNRFIAYRYGRAIADDDAGLAVVEAMLHHLARLKDPQWQMSDFIAMRAPFIAGGERDALIAGILANPHRFGADALAKKIKLTAAQRARLGITTIGASDMNAEQRKAMRKLKEIERKRKKRRAAGAKPRAEYLAQSIEQTKPWEAEGISRATWHRRRKKAAVPAAERPANDARTQLPRFEASSINAGCNSLYAAVTPVSRLRSRLG